ncbi:MAG: thioredoxin family protein [Gammaproteobacteria bacterium]|nr:thioredoxin family protein [Gammaproteobacteria bacterium]MCP5196345.1 thioredoxin family protein [Gammaproteobacteria bacterium]
MAQTASTMLPLGTLAPDFSLPEPATGKTVSLADFQDAPVLLVMVICNHCPFVKHIRQGLTQFARDYQVKGLATVAFSANDVANYPDDSPARMAEEASRFGYSFPYLYDESQRVAKAYHAACTPDFFLFDADRKLVYRGQFDGSRPGNQIPVTGADLRAAVDAVLASQSVSADQKPSIGCNIKWKVGAEPDYDPSR